MVSWDASNPEQRSHSLQSSSSYSTRQRAGRSQSWTLSHLSGICGFSADADEGDGLASGDGVKSATEALAVNGAGAGRRPNAPCE